MIERVKNCYQITDLTIQVEKLKKVAKENDEFYQLYKKNYEEATITIHDLNQKFKQLDKDGSQFRSKAEELEADKQKQRNEFIVLQAKAVKMTNILKNLAMYISGHLEENKLLKKQLERCDKRLHLGVHDMTPRPDYREIFKRREFKHFKEDFLMKILRQELTTSEIIENIIDVVKGYESRLHFARGTHQQNQSSQQLQPKPVTSKTLKKKTLASLKQLALEGSGGMEGRGSLIGKQKTAQVQEGGSSRHTESGSPRSSRLLSTAGANNMAPQQRRIPPFQRRPPSGSRSSSSSSSLDSVASRLSDQNYAAVRAIEQGMEEINKDLQKLVNI